MRTPTSTWRLLKQAGADMMDDKVPMMGAALAYYTAFSIAPLLVIAIGIVGLVFGKNGAEGVFETVRGLVGVNGAAAIQSMVRGAANEPRGGLIAAILGFLTLVVGATGVFGQLQDSLNLIWKVAPKPSAGWWALVRQRLLSLGMVVVVAFLLLVSLLVSAALAAAGRLVDGSALGGEPVWHALNLLVSLVISAFLFASVYKVLPDVKLSWREVLTGGAVTALLFTIGKFLIGFYLGKSSVASAYGAAGSFVIVLLWVYYSSQIVLFGAELTHAYATRGGRPVTPKGVAQVTVAPFNAAAMAEREARRRPGPPSSPLRAAGGACLLLGVLLLGGAALSRRRRTAGYAAGGALAGLGLGLLAGLEARARLPGWKEKARALAWKAVRRVPPRVTFAAAKGAVKAGGAEAAREAVEAVRQKAGRATAGAKELLAESRR